MPFSPKHDLTPLELQNLLAERAATIDLSDATLVFHSGMTPSEIRSKFDALIARARSSTANTPDSAAQPGTLSP